MFCYQVDINMVNSRRNEAEKPGSNYGVLLLDDTICGNYKNTHTYLTD